MSFKRPLRWIASPALLFFAFLAPLSAFAQSCALCYTQAASATQRFIEALRSGILILIVPPMLMSVAVMIACYRKRNQFHQPASTPESDNSW